MGSRIGRLVEIHQTPHLVFQCSSSCPLGANFDVPASRIGWSSLQSCAGLRASVSVNSCSMFAQIFLPFFVFSLEYFLPVVLAVALPFPLVLALVVAVAVVDDDGDAVALETFDVVNYHRQHYLLSFHLAMRLFVLLIINHLVCLDDSLAVDNLFFDLSSHYPADVNADVNVVVELMWMSLLAERISKR